MPHFFSETRTPIAPRKALIIADGYVPPSAIREFDPATPDRRIAPAMSVNLTQWLMRFEVAAKRSFRRMKSKPDFMGRPGCSCGSHLNEIGGFMKAWIR